MQNIKLESSMVINSLTTLQDCVNNVFKAP